MTRDDHKRIDRGFASFFLKNYSVTILIIFLTEFRVANVRKTFIFFNDFSYVLSLRKLRLIVFVEDICFNCFDVRLATI